MKTQRLLTLICVFILSFNNWATPINNVEFDTIIKTKNCQIKIHSQTSIEGKNTNKSKFISINYAPTSETLSEADSKNIKKDKVYFELVYDQNCILNAITIKKKGQLVNFNMEAELLCVELFNEIKKPEISKFFENNSSGKCENALMALTFYLE